jgi:hypothetical protein
MLPQRLPLDSNADGEAELTSTELSQVSGGDPQGTSPPSTDPRPAGKGDTPQWVNTTPSRFGLSTSPPHARE